MLAQGCHKLLASRDYSDMQFILSPHAHPAPLSSSSSPLNTTDKDRSTSAAVSSKGVVIPAHRVIVAARCEYFRRALQSGMKEAIDK